MTASCQRSPANARIDSTSSQTVTYTYSVEDGSRGLPTWWATSPACCDTSGIAVSRRNTSNSRSLPGWIVGLKTRMITVFSSLDELARHGILLAATSSPGTRRLTSLACSGGRLVDAPGCDHGRSDAAGH